MTQGYPWRTLFVFPGVVGTLIQRTANYPASAPARTIHRGSPGSVLTSSLQHWRRIPFTIAMYRWEFLRHDVGENPLHRRQSGHLSYPPTPLLPQPLLPLHCFSLTVPSPFPSQAIYTCCPWCLEDSRPLSTCSCHFLLYTHTCSRYLFFRFQLKGVSSGKSILLTFKSIYTLMYIYTYLNCHS